MKKTTSIIIIAVIAIFFTACSSREKKLEKITKLEKELFSDKVTRLDTTKANEIIKLYISFAEDFSSDSLAPVYLFRAADLSMNMQNGNQAVQLFDKVIQKYPKYEKTPDSYFLCAFAYENVLKNFTKANQYYTDFIAKFPTHALFNDAKVSLSNLGKTPEQLVAEFEAKQSAQDSLQQLAEKKK